jgi:transposase
MQTSRQSVWTSRSRFFSSTALTPPVQVVIRRQLKRRLMLSFLEKLPPCLVGIEACASSHHWSPRAVDVGAYGAMDASGPCGAICQTGRNHARA